MTAHAPVHDLNGKAVERLRQLIGQTQSEVPGLNVGLTGEPVIEHDEMQQSQKDATVASVVSLVICALIFIYGYSENRLLPVKATYLPSGRAGLYAGIRDADRRTPEHFYPSLSCRSSSDWRLISGCIWSRVTRKSCDVANQRKKS